MRLSSPRNAVILGTYFTRRGKAVTRSLAVVVGLVMALALSGLFGLLAFITHVGDVGQARDFGSFSEQGCVQGTYRYDPVGLEQYTKYLLASTCTDPPVPAGLPRFPRAGEIFVSPALNALRRSDDNIRTRFPQVDGEIGRDGLTGSNELFAIVGVEPAKAPLPIGVTSFDHFGSDADYLENYLRFGRTVFFVIGLFFTLLPGCYLIAACTRLNARTRHRQLGLLSVVGLDAAGLRGALTIESALTVGGGALVGLVIAPPLLSRVTPTFVGWTAFPGDFSIGLPKFPIVFFLVVGLAVVAAWIGGRAVTRRSTSRPSVANANSAFWRWGLLALGVVAAIVTRWWNSDSASPLVLGGRVITFIGLLLVAPLLCAFVGRKLSLSDNASTALVGARLRQPSGALTRALAALMSGLFVVSAGATSISSLGGDPAGLEQAYAADGLSVVEVRRPGAATRSLLKNYDVLTGTNNSSSPEISGTLTGSCPTLRMVVGGNVSCRTPSLYGVTYPGQTPPAGTKAAVVPLIGFRADALSGFIITVRDRTVVGDTDDDVFVPLNTDQAYRLYDQLVGDDPAVNVRIVGSADVSGASELDTILDVFRWGAIFAILASLLATLISLVALLYDRQAANNYLQILGVTRLGVARVAMKEVTAASGATVLVAFVCATFWALSLGGSGAPTNLFEVALPFVAVLLALVIAAAVVVWMTLRSAAVSVVPDRDGLVSAFDTFRPASPVGADTDGLNEGRRPVSASR